MKKSKFSHKVIAVFLTLNFLTTIIPVNYLFANNNGPGSPEAAGFEPVDATDMVSLSTGDLSYVLPLMSVEGFPVSLSYHAGMTADMDASWAGLGWYLNPGAINRSVTNTPDDWKSGVGINFNSYENVTNYYGVTVELGFPVGASVGVGLNWGGGHGMSGSVFASTHTFKLGDMAKAGPNAGVSASTSGDVTVNAGVGASFLSFQAGASVSYSLKNQWNLSGGVGVKVANNTYLGMGTSLNGGFGIGMSAGSATANNGAKGGASAGMSSNSFSSGDASIDSQSSGIALPLHVIGIPITLGFRKTKVKVNIKKGFINYEWGALYANSYDYTDNSARTYDVLNYNEIFDDYAARTRSVDAYSTRLPQSEEQFIGDNSKDIENINFTFMGYDSYNVAAQGLMGNMTPRIFQNATIFGKGERTKNAIGDDIHAFWHHGDDLDTNFTQRKLGNPDNVYNSNDLYFYFDGQFTSIEKNDAPSIISNSGNTALFIDDLVNTGTHNSTSSNNYGRAKSPNFVEVFTNNQIFTGHATSRGLVTPATILNSDRNNTSKFDPDGIGAYKITGPDGKTYHFALPVYHYEQIHRGQIDEVEDSNTFDIDNVNEKRQFSRYATHWLLTAITGSDYIDSNSNGEFDKTDYGYWVELEYGKWSDGYVWRSPYQDGVYNYSTALNDKIEEKDKGSYSFGRKQLYYLDKINTRNRTALFVKDIRYDALGKDLNFKFSNSNNSGSNVIGNTGSGNNPNSLNYTPSGVHVKESGVSYKPEYSLKLSKIVLVDGDIGKTLSKNTTSSNLNHEGLYNNYSANSTNSPTWDSPYFHSAYTTNYSYPIHNEQDVLDVNDVSQSFIAQNALKVVELNHSYTLAKNSPSSQNAPNTSSNDSSIGNSSKGRLTLESVQIKGKGGASYVPPTSFNYYLEDMDNVYGDIDTAASTNLTSNPPSDTQIRDFVKDKRDFMDSWGFLEGEEIENGITHNRIKAWSLKDITMPTGAKIEIDYEEDEYWTEAFSRRVYNEGFLYRATYYNGFKAIEFEIDQNYAYKDELDLLKNFDSSKPAFIDLFLFKNHYEFLNAHHDWINFKAESEILYLDSDKIIFKVPTSISDPSYKGGCFSTSKIYDGTYSHIDSWHTVNGQSCSSTSGQNEWRRNYKFLANTVPLDETGGGLRVSELRTLDGSGNTYKVDYDYTHPTENRSSGITSYAPIDGLKFVPYQSEIPAPGVMYEYVTMKETSNTGDFSSKTRYRHHVLKPVLDIFNPNIEMEALDSDAPGEDRIFWATVTEDYGNLDGNNSRDIEAKKIDIHINSALIGQIKSIENLNSENHVMFKTENEYINGSLLVNQEPNKGYVKETFNSLKSVFQTNGDGDIVQDEKRLLSISSKTEYNNMLKTSTTISNGQKSSVEYSDVDPRLSSFRKSETTLADGTKVTSARIPAYEKYTKMGSMVTNPTYKNMLSQEVMNITSIDVNGSQLTTNASITTWNDDWTYRDNFGIEPTSSSETPVWRKHKTYVWKDAINATTGAYNTTVNETSNYFDWGLGAPTSSKWQNVSEITRYTHWSSPIETKDINNNFATSKMVDNFNKVVASGNARYTEMYYCGAEYVASGNSFEGEVLGANYRQNVTAHTGSYSVKTNNANDKVFEISGDVGANHDDNTKNFRPGIYKVSFWMYNPSITVENQTGAAVKLNGVTQTLAETVEAGSWKQYNYYVNLSANTNGINIHVTNTSAGNYYFDDFRMHPVYASMNSYVYDEDTDELISILDANNMATKYVYDPAGRLCKTYVETINSTTPVFTGGFKLVSENEYYYKGLPVIDCGDCCSLALP